MKRLFKHLRSGEERKEPVYEWTEIKIADALINEEIVYDDASYYLMDVIAGKHIVVLIERDALFHRLRYARLTEKCFARRIVK